MRPRGSPGGLLNLEKRRGGPTDGPNLPSLIFAAGWYNGGMIENQNQRGGTKRGVQDQEVCGPDRGGDRKWKAPTPEASAAKDTAWTRAGRSSAQARS